MHIICKHIHLQAQIQAVCPHTWIRSLFSSLKRALMRRCAIVMKLPYMMDDENSTCVRSAQEMLRRSERRHCGSRGLGGSEICSWGSGEWEDQRDVIQDQGIGRIRKILLRIRGVRGSERYDWGSGEWEDQREITRMRVTNERDNDFGYQDQGRRVIIYLGWMALGSGVGTKIRTRWCRVPG